MEIIYKYKLSLVEEQELDLPIDAEVLSIQKQGDSICAWVKLDTEKKVYSRKILIYGTGQPISEHWLKHITTLQMGVIYRRIEI